MSSGFHDQDVAHVGPSLPRSMQDLAPHDIKTPELHAPEILRKEKSGFLDVKSLQSADSTASSQASIRAASSKTSDPGIYSNFGDHMLLPVEPYGRDVHERIVHADMRGKYAMERLQLREAQQRWMTAAAKVCPFLRRQSEDEEGFAQLERAWMDIQAIEPRALSYETNLDALDEDLAVPQTIARQSDLSEGVLPLGEHFHRPELELSKDAAHKESDLPELVDKYFHHLSAVRYLSDELINLGNRPSDDLAGSLLDEDGEEMEHASVAMTNHEYAERHLQLLRELEFERQEEARYRELCQRRGFKIGTASEDEGSEEEHMYGDLLEEKEYGPSRIESIVAVNTFQDRYPSEMAPVTTQSDGSSRVAQWAKTVSSHQSEAAASPTHSPYAFEPSVVIPKVVEPISTLEHCHTFLERDTSADRPPSRRRSTSSIQRVRYKVPISYPHRSDSGYDF